MKTRFSLVLLPLLLVACDPSDVAEGIADEVTCAAKLCPLDTRCMATEHGPVCAPSCETDDDCGEGWVCCTSTVGPHCAQSADCV